MDLSIITVSYNDKEVLDVTLEAVYASKTKYTYEMIIVNNDSPDDSMQMVRQKYLSKPEISAKTVVIENKTNLMFAKGNNVGLKAAKGDYMLLLNSDTKLDEDNLEEMLHFMKSRPDVGIATCKLVKPDGTLDAASRRSEPNPTIAFYRLSGLQFMFPKRFGAYNILNSDIEQDSEIDACVGAYMMLSRKAYEATGGFDERYISYGEDLDLCRMVRESGLKIWWHPKTSCIHFKGQSSKKTPQKALYAFHQAMWIYYDKWYRKNSSIFLDIFVYSGVWGRYYWKTFRNFFRPVNKKFVSK